LKSGLLVEKGLATGDHQSLHVSHEERNEETITMSTKTIGITTKYIGDELPGLKGRQVRILGVMRNALLPDVDVDAADYFVRDDHTLERLGGVTKHDRLDVVQLGANGRESFVHCDPRAIDLECFASLKG
jgi:HD superfamily phosphohydrolase